MRLALLWALALALAPTVLAQGNETNATNETGASPGDVQPDEGPAANETPAGPVSITLEAHTAGGGGYFTLEGQSQRNPVLAVPPGAEVTVTLKGMDDGVHNFCFNDNQHCTQYVTGPGDTQTLTFTAPASGTVQYYCLPHKGAGMAGQVAAGDAPAGGGNASGGGDAGEIVGESVDLGDLGHPECAGYKIPAVVTQNVVGGPTVEDYAKMCKTGGTVQEARPAHPADYVIPISFGLIGLGIVGMVWAHRFYKP